jgi:hypothetical protein
MTAGTRCLPHFVAASFERASASLSRTGATSYMNVYDSGDYWLLAAFLWLATWLVAYVSPRFL